MSGRRITRAQYEAGRALFRRVTALHTLPPSLPLLAKRYIDAKSSGCFGWDPLTVPIAERLDRFKADKDIPF